MAVTCSQTGTVTFASPGLSYGGTITKKTTAKNTAGITAANIGLGTACSTTEVKLKIVGPTYACTNSVASCAARTSKEVIKDPYYDDTALSYILNASTNLQTSLANGIKTKDAGASVILEYGTAAAVLAGHACGANIGFQVTGAVDTTAAVPTGLNYVDTICLVDDSGTSTTHNFAADVNSAAGGGVPVIQTATIGSRQPAGHQLS